MHGLAQASSSTFLPPFRGRAGNFLFFVYMEGSVLIFVIAGGVEVEKDIVECGLRDYVLEASTAFFSLADILAIGF